MSALSNAYRAHQEAQERTRGTLEWLRHVIGREREAGRTWTDIGNELGLSRSRVQRIAYPKGAGQ